MTHDREEETVADNPAEVPTGVEQQVTSGAAGAVHPPLTPVVQPFKILELDDEQHGDALLDLLDTIVPVLERAALLEYALGRLVGPVDPYLERLRIADAIDPEGEGEG